MKEMTVTGLKSFKTAIATLSVRKPPMSAKYVENEIGDADVANIDPRLIEEVVTYKVKRTWAIQHHKETGEEITRFTFNDQNTHLRVS